MQGTYMYVFVYECMPLARYLRAAKEIWAVFGYQFTTGNRGKTAYRYCPSRYGSQVAVISDGADKTLDRLNLENAHENRKKLQWHAFRMGFTCGKHGQVSKEHHSSHACWKALMYLKRRRKQDGTSLACSLAYMTYVWLIMRARRSALQSDENWLIHVTMNK